MMGMLMGMQMQSEMGLASEEGSWTALLLQSSHCTFFSAEMP
jgi:hypothetical protein